MQTFITHQTDFAATAVCLDPLRLCAQIKEAMQVYNANFLGGKHQGNPHAYAMWADYPEALVLYGCAMYTEWKRRYIDGERGGKPTHKNGVEFERLLTGIDPAQVCYPNWLQDDNVCASHRAALLFKLPEWYSRFGWSEEPATPDTKGRLPYVWPV